MRVHFFTSNILEYAIKFCVNQGSIELQNLWNESVNNLYPYIYNNIHSSRMLGFKSSIH